MLGAVVPSCNLSTSEMETRESGVQGHSLLYPKFEANLGCMRAYLKKTWGRGEKSGNLALGGWHDGSRVVWV